MPRGVKKRRDSWTEWRPENTHGPVSTGVFVRSKFRKQAEKLRAAAIKNQRKKFDVEADRRAEEFELSQWPVPLGQWETA